MKLRFSSTICTLLVMLGMISCTKENWRETDLPPTDIDAEEVVLTDILFSDGERVRPYYIFTVELGTAGATKTGSGIVLEAKFVSNSTALHQAVYSPAESLQAGHNNFVIGNDGSKLYVNGTAYTITAGSIDVKAEGDSYSLTGKVKLDNNTWYDLAWEGAPLSWGKLPVVTKLIEATAQSNLANGVNSITLTLSDGNWQETYNEQWQAVVTGKGNYLAVDLYSADGYLAPGTYKASAVGGIINEGEFGIGYDTTLDFGLGPMEFKDWGTCWWTVDESAEVQKTAEKIVEGEIVVELAKDNTYTIYMDNDQLIAEFTGKIPAVTKPEDKPNTGGDEEELVGDVVIKMNGLTYTMTDDTANNTAADGSALSGVTLYYVEVKDASGNVVGIFDFVTAEGAASLVGEYTVSSYPDAVGEAGNGFDFRSWGWDLYGGTILTDAEGTNYSINEGSTISVTDRNGALVFLVNGTFTDASGAAKTIAAKYVIGEETASGGGDSIEYTTLSTYLNFTDYVSTYGMNLVGVELGSDGMYTEAWTWGEYSGITVKGNGNYLKVEFYSADGTLAPGTYVPCATESTPQEGEFNYGYDYVSDWGTSIYGSCWSTYESDQATATEKITDGKIIVDVEDGIYTIKLQSSTVNAKYVGKLSAE